ncbi:ribosome assembly RNA-binding protein YhbY [Desulfogranum japonicum]|uniref:ribosome assembly RNA-binding protein YhbY n=1 Tax=Desulfogranum japonicum TaxID=231447 RepID=UPI000400B44A|nr:ribosome assembly RNA-binding protein YhbY [Desulfogranum japonicum]
MDNALKNSHDDSTAAQNPPDTRLSSQQRRSLRSLGHHLVPAVYIGREGITAPVIRSVSTSLDAHELIKVKIGQNCPIGKKEAAESLAMDTSSELVQLIGKMVLLYRANPKLKADKRIAV